VSGEPCRDSARICPISSCPRRTRGRNRQSPMLFPQSSTSRTRRLPLPVHHRLAERGTIHQRLTAGHTIPTSWVKRWVTRRAQKSTAQSGHHQSRSTPCLWHPSTQRHHGSLVGSEAGAVLLRDGILKIAHRTRILQPSTTTPRPIPSQATNTTRSPRRRKAGRTV